MWLHVDYSYNIIEYSTLNHEHFFLNVNLKCFIGVEDPCSLSETIEM